VLILIADYRANLKHITHIVIYLVYDYYIIMYSTIRYYSVSEIRSFFKRSRGAEGNAPGALSFASR
ncbi:hypothetical protein, partial [Nostoc sp. 'Peltigera malacea cyanobiont' DB3992]|uniref:hypothetical protein n=1 Tax=Nostoc sp. 'Peltigera malacea cyanobiont' DB3992 TaxID=1206980 RepID=UPI00211F29A5